MKLTSRVPRYIAWPMRLVAYAVFLSIILALIAFIENLRTNEFASRCLEKLPKDEGEIIDPLPRAREFANCVRGKSNFFDNFWFSKTYQVLDSLPMTPANYVGVWQIEDQDCEMRLELHASGFFSSEIVRCPAPYGMELTGRWGAAHGRLALLPLHYIRWPIDINRFWFQSNDTFHMFTLEHRFSKFTRLPDLLDQCHSACRDYETANWLCPAECLGNDESELPAGALLRDAAWNSNPGDSR